MSGEGKSEVMLWKQFLNFMKALQVWMKIMTMTFTFGYAKWKKDGAWKKITLPENYEEYKEVEGCKNLAGCF